MNDKYQASLISFNPIRERGKHYEWERDQFEKIKGQFTGKLMKKIQIENLKRDIERLENEVESENLMENNLDSKYDKMFDRPDLPGVEGT